MNAKLSKMLLALALIGVAGSAAAHGGDDRRGGRHDHGRDDGWRKEWRHHDRDPWCREHRAYHRHWDVRRWAHDSYHRRDRVRGGYRSEYWGPYDRYNDDVTIIFRGDFR